MHYIVYGHESDVTPPLYRNYTLSHYGIHSASISSHVVLDNILHSTSVTYLRGKDPTINMTLVCLIKQQSAKHFNIQQCPQSESRWANVKL